MDSQILPDRNGLGRSTRNGARLISALALTTLVAIASGSLQAGTNVWTTNGPYGGPVKDLAVDPQTPANLYLVGNGTLFRSTDGGAHWKHAVTGLADPTVASLAIDPVTPTTLYAGTLEGGSLARSVDGGSNWAPLPTGPTLAVAIAVDPKAPTTLYAAQQQNGIRKSIDGGATWFNIGAATLPSFPTFDALVIDPQTPSTVYAGEHSKGIYKSVDGGATWVPANTGFTGPIIQIFRLAIDPQTPSNLYVAASTSGGDGVFSSTDGGAHWTRTLAPSAANNFYIGTVSVDPQTPSTIYVGTGNGPFKSIDSGAHFTPIRTGIPAGFVNVIAINPKSAGTLYAGTSDGVFATTNAGDGWTASSNGLTLSSVNAVAIDPQTPTTVYAGTTYSGLFKSTDGGGSWAAINVGVGATGNTNCALPRIISLAIDPAVPSTLYAGTTCTISSGVLKSVNGGASWAPAAVGLPAFGSIVALVVDPSNSLNLVAGTTNAGAYRSTDGGATWARASNGLLDASGVVGLAYGPTTPQSLWAAVDSDADDVFMISTDGAATWSSTYPGFDTSAGLVSVINFLHNSAGIRALALSANPPFLPLYGPPYPTTIGVDLFTCLPITMLLADPNVASNSYVAAGCGVLRGTNDGAQLTAMNEGLPPSLAVNALAITPSGDTLYAGAKSGGVYRFDVGNAPTPNYQGLWWNDPPGSESGWGVNFAHQGDIIFATWYTYDANGKPLWLAVQADRTAPGVYSGNLFTTTGPAFDAVPFDPSIVTETTVGTATFTFTDDDHATFAYTVDVDTAKSAVTQSKSITRQAFGALPSCVWGGQPNPALATNYTDLWWKQPAVSESGWGINFTHQGDTIFATWFTYDAAGKPWWLAFVANKTSPGIYAGDVFTTTGPPFNAVPFDPATVVETTIGTATLTFTDGNNATFAYTVNGEAQAKAITRQVFVPPGTVCQ